MQAEVCVCAESPEKPSFSEGLHLWPLLYLSLNLLAISSSQGNTCLYS